MLDELRQMQLDTRRPGRQQHLEELGVADRGDDGGWEEICPKGQVGELVEVAFEEVGRGGAVDVMANTPRRMGRELPALVEHSTRQDPMTAVAAVMVREARRSAAARPG